METRPRVWGWIGRLQPRTFDRLLVAVLLFVGLINALFDLRSAERDRAYPLRDRVQAVIFAYEIGLIKPGAN